MARKPVLKKKSSGEGRQKKKLGLLGFQKGYGIEQVPDIKGNLINEENRQFTEPRKANATSEMKASVSNSKKSKRTFPTRSESYRVGA